MRRVDRADRRLPSPLPLQGLFKTRPPVYRRPWASASMAMASLRVPSAAESPRSMAASSSTRAPSSSGAIVVRVRPALDLLADDPLPPGVAGHLGQVGHADDLVMASPARPGSCPGPSRAGRRRRCRSRRRPASARGRRPASTVLAASVTRDSSPPEAILRSGRGSSPGLAEKSISTRSTPDSGGVGAVGSSPSSRASTSTVSRAPVQAEGLEPRPGWPSPNALATLPTRGGQRRRRPA